MFRSTTFLRHRTVIQNLQKSELLVMGHSLICLLVCLYLSLAPELMGQRTIFVQFLWCSESCAMRCSLNAFHQGDSGAGSSFASLPEGDASTRRTTSGRRSRAKPESARLIGVDASPPPRLSDPVTHSISSLPIVIPKGKAQSL